MQTVARTHSEHGAHWYSKSGEPFYEIAKKDGSGMRAVTLADARKLNLLPGVSKILSTLHKEALVSWRIEQACLAVLTTPRLPNEALDAFVERTLHTERVQDQESQIARDRGTEIHEAMEVLANVTDFKRGTTQLNSEILPWVLPAWDAVSEYGETYETESILVGNGYAGRTDLIQEQKPSATMILWDFKSTKKLPKSEPWPEHQLQLSAYAMALLGKLIGAFIMCKNCYISTVDCGAFVILDVPNWAETYNEGFVPLVRHWQWSTGYTPV
jgi:hypothetical protein